MAEVKKWSAGFYDASRWKQKMQIDNGRVINTDFEFANDRALVFTNNKIDS